MKQLLVSSVSRAASSPDRELKTGMGQGRHNDKTENRDRCAVEKELIYNQQTQKQNGVTWWQLGEILEVQDRLQADRRDAGGSAHEEREKKNLQSTEVQTSKWLEHNVAGGH